MFSFCVPGRKRFTGRLNHTWKNEKQSNFYAAIAKAVLRAIWLPLFATDSWRASVKISARFNPRAPMPRASSRFVKMAIVIGGNNGGGDSFEKWWPRSSLDSQRGRRGKLSTRTEVKPMAPPVWPTSRRSSPCRLFSQSVFVINLVSSVETPDRLLRNVEISIKSSNIKQASTKLFPYRNCDNAPRNKPPESIAATRKPLALWGADDGPPELAHQRIAWHHSSCGGVGG